MRSATLSEVSGPNSAVTGRRRNDRAVTDVFESRLIPWGWNIAVEKNGLWPWVSATYGHSKNQVNSEVSEHAHVVPREMPRASTWAYIASDPQR